MNNYSLTGAEMIDPDMRFNPRGHIFLLPVGSGKTDFADTRSENAGREFRIETILAKFLRLPVRHRKDGRTAH